MRRAVIVATLGLVLGMGEASAQMSDGVVRIGVLNDQSSLFSDSSGLGSVAAAKMAVEDFGSNLGGTPIEVIAADHQNKPDVGSAVARQWFDEGRVDVVADLGNSAVALSVADIARQRGKIVLVSAGASSALTGRACSPTLIHWTYDDWSVANTLARALTKGPQDAWFFMTADYAFGVGLETVAKAIVGTLGGKVVGSIRHPINTSDFSSYLLQASSSGANIVALANGGDDTANALKQAREFGLDRGGLRVAALAATISDVHAIGLEAARGLLFSEAFYWDQNEGTRGFARRFAQRYKGRMPTSIQAGVYAAVLHYLKVVKATGTDDGVRVVQAMKQTPTEDALFGHGAIRSDGRVVHDMYLFQVKASGDSKGPWDYLQLVATVPGGEAFRPLAEGGCPLVTN